MMRITLVSCNELQWHKTQGKHARLLTLCVKKERSHSWKRLMEQTLGENLWNCGEETLTLSPSDSTYSRNILNSHWPWRCPHLTTSWCLLMMNLSFPLPFKSIQNLLFLNCHTNTMKLLLINPMAQIRNLRVRSCTDLHRARSSSTQTQYLAYVKVSRASAWSDWTWPPDD
jgi:hypothetical protein